MGSNGHLYLQIVRDAAFAAADAPPGGSSLMSSLMFMLIIFGVMWFFLIWPNQRREKERRAMLAALGKGDRVVTTGGIYGTIVGLNDKTVVLRVSDEPSVKLEVVRGAVSQVADKPAKESKD